MDCELPDWLCRPSADHGARYVLRFTCGHDQAICQAGLMWYWYSMLAYRYNCRCHVCKRRPVLIEGVSALPVPRSR